MKYEKAHFEKMFENYNSVEGNDWGINWRASHKKRIEIALDMLIPVLKRKDISILEIGCATGDVTEKILQINHNIKRYDALDISENAIRICKSKEIRQVNFICNSISKQDLPAGSYDLIICMDVIYYLNGMKQQACMENMYKALKPGGQLLICVPYDEKEIYRLLNTKNAYSIASIKLNRNWLWAVIDQKLMMLYKKDIPKWLKRMIYLILSDSILMELAYCLCRILRIERYTHFYIDYRKCVGG